jgi:hypothetical protein
VPNYGVVNSVVAAKVTFPFKTGVFQHLAEGVATSARRSPASCRTESVPIKLIEYLCRSGGEDVANPNRERNEVNPIEDCGLRVGT